MARFSMTHWSHNEFHLGDNLIHLHFLRKLALKNPEDQFRHAVHPCHIDQLAEAIEGVSNLRLIPLDQKPLASVNVWKNAGATVTEGRPGGRYVPGYWEQHEYRNNYAWFYLAWFEHLSRQMGLENPIKYYKDLWFDYPNILRTNQKVMNLLAALCGSSCAQNPPPRFDFLIVNSRPSSGQFRAYDSTEYLTPLIEELSLRYKVVVTQPVPASAKLKESRFVCTMDYGLTISEIGNLSLFADHLVMVSTGPSWPTFNVWNADTVKLRLLFLDTEIVDYIPNLVQVNTVQKAREVLKGKSLL